MTSSAGSSAGRLTTHVLDTASGIPARGMTCRLFRVSGDQKTLVKDVTTNNDGRVDNPLLEGTDFKVGSYELLFNAGSYFAGKPGAPATPFLSEIPIRFTIADANSHYHVPLLVSPWAYSTYRGS